MRSRDESASEEDLPVAQVDHRQRAKTFCLKLYTHQKHTEI